MTKTTRPLGIPADELESKPLASPVSGADTVRSRVEWTNDARTVISGVWEADPGVSRWEFLSHGEIVHIVRGAMTVQRDGESPVDLTAGDAAFFPLGWTGTWTVTEPVRKFYVVYKEPTSS